MTLIVASAQHDIQFIVADRRISIGGVLVDDEAYKILQYWNSEQAYQFLIAYTGLAEFSSWNTLQWIMETLPKVFDTSKEINNAINVFCNKCEQSINRIVGLPPKNKALALILCGRYNKNGSDTSNPEYIPFLTIISNCINEHGSQIGSVSSKFISFSSRLKV